MTPATSLLSDGIRLCVTFAIAGSIGYGLLLLNAPAPFLLGSLFGVWIIGGLVPQIRPHLGVARWFHIPIVIGLGVLIGSFFTAEILMQSGKWIDTVLVTAFVTMAVTMAGYLFLTRLRSYDPMTAFLCSVPGGQVEVVAIARDTIDKDYVVALFHLVRVVFVFSSTPLLLAFLQDAEAVKASNQAMLSLPSLFDLSWQELAGFIGLSVAGFWLAKLIGLPMPHMLGPVFISIAAHSTGLIFIPRCTEFVLLAQLSIGGAIGARLAQVRFGELLTYIKDAIINALIILSLYGVATIIMASITGNSMLQIWLAFIPGGYYEVTLLALIFGFDIAFVAFHHTIRTMMIYLFLPAIAVKLRPGTSADNRPNS